GAFSARRILIATGSEPASLPGFPFDGRHIVSSDEALSFDGVPERLLVIGAGAIGLELGSVWARLGASVHGVELMDRVAPVPGVDRDVAKALQRVLERQRLTFQLGGSARKARVLNGRVEATIEAGGAASSDSFDRILVAVGRRPFHDGLGLE